MPTPQTVSYPQPRPNMPPQPPVQSIAVPGELFQNNGNILISSAPSIDGQMPQTFTLDEKTVQLAMQAAGIFKENIYSLDTEQRMKLWKRLGEMGVIPGQQLMLNR